MQTRINTLFQRLNFTKLSWTIIVFGVVLRVVQYAANRSLSLDEAMLALNIVNRSFAELLQPLSYDQGAPIGFLLIEKFAIQTLGNSEYVLRLFPLFSGIGALLLFYGVAKRSIASKFVPLALVLFAISEPLIYYASEVKQYSSDVAIALLLLWAIADFRSDRLKVSKTILLGVLGAIAIWFSHPAVFILTGIGSTLALFSLVRKDWRAIARLSIAYVPWALSFLALYHVSLGDLAENEGLLGFWSPDFAPFPPTSFSDLKWFVDTFFEVFKFPIGITLSGLAALTFLIGSIYTFLKDKERFSLLSSPIFFTLIASAMGLYPFRGRLLLFLVPFALLFIVTGIWQITKKIEPGSIMVGAILVGLLIFQPLLTATYHLIVPRTHVGGFEIVEDIKPVLSYVQDHNQNDDILYIYRSAEAAFAYYQQRYVFGDDEVVVGVDSKGNWSGYAKDLDTLSVKHRAWIVFSHFQSKGSQAEVDFYLYYLDTLGTQLDSFESIGAAVYLYIFNE